MVWRWPPSSRSTSRSTSTAPTASSRWSSPSSHTTPLASRRSSKPSSSIWHVSRRLLTRPPTPAVGSVESLPTSHPQLGPAQPLAAFRSEFAPLADPLPRQRLVRLRAFFLASSLRQNKQTRRVLPRAPLHDPPRRMTRDEAERLDSLWWRPPPGQPSYTWLNAQRGHAVWSNDEPEEMSPQERETLDRRMWTRPAIDRTWDGRAVPERRITPVYWGSTISYRWGPSDDEGREDERRERRRVEERKLAGSGEEERAERWLLSLGFEHADEIIPLEVNPFASEARSRPPRRALLRAILRPFVHLVRRARHHEKEEEDEAYSEADSERVQASIPRLLRAFGRKRKPEAERASEPKPPPIRQDEPRASPPPLRPSPSMISRTTSHGGPGSVPCIMRRPDPLATTLLDS